MICVPVLYSMLVSQAVGLQAVVTADGFADDGTDEIVTSTVPPTSCYTAQYGVTNMVIRVGSGVDLESDLQDSCNADSTCLGYVHKTNGKYVMLEDGGLSCDEDLKVGFSWIVSIQTKGDCGLTTAVPSCYSSQYGFSGKMQLRSFSSVQTEPDAQSLCNADSTCLGYILKTNGNFVAIEVGLTDTDFKVGFDWITAVHPKAECGGPSPAPSCYTPEYSVSRVQLKDFSGVHTELDAQDLCDRDLSCIGYVHRTSGVYQVMEAGTCSSHTELKVGYDWIVSIQTKGDCGVTPPTPSCYTPQYGVSGAEIKAFSGVQVESDAQVLCSTHSTCLGYIHQTNGEYTAMEAKCGSTDEDFKVGYDWIVSLQSKGDCGVTTAVPSCYTPEYGVTGMKLRAFSSVQVESDAQALCNGDSTCLGYIHRTNGKYVALEAASCSTETDLKVGFDWIVSVQKKRESCPPLLTCAYDKTSSIDNGQLRVFSKVQTEADAQVLCNSDSTCLGYAYKDDGTWVAIEAGTGLDTCPEILEIYSKCACQ